MPSFSRPPAGVADFGQGSISQLPLHRNPGLEIVYLSRGHLRWEVEGRPEQVRPESVFYTFPWERHGSRDEYEPGHFWHWVLFRLRGPAGRFSFHPSLGFSEHETARIRRVLRGTGERRTFPATRDVAWILPRLIAECRDGGPLSAPAIVSLSRLLILELVRCVQPGRKERQIVPGVETRMRHCVQAIRERAHEPWTLATMARLAGLNRTRFAALLKTMTGDAPTIYLRRMRVLRAQEWLRDTDRSITEIAHRSGFSTSQHFARIFKQFSGRTARDYREDSPRRRRAGVKSMAHKQKKKPA